jgi:tetratricopeptide (TPR) repeat protein
MKLISLIVNSALSVSLLMSSASFATASLASDLKAVQDSWATVNYELQDKAKVAGFEALVKESEALVNHYPNNAESHIWHGIVQSSYAGAKGGLGALGLAEAAKAELEQAISIDEKALQGSALTSLGTLYAKVPGWPIGFGSDKKAQALFKKSLEINPEGLDINYFYAEFLYDEFRQMEVDDLIAKVEKKLKKSR